MDGIYIKVKNEIKTNYFWMFGLIATGMQFRDADGLSAYRHYRPLL
jgi:hypothetical protein